MKRETAFFFLSYFLSHSSLNFQNVEIKLCSVVKYILRIAIQLGLHLRPFLGYLNKLGMYIIVYTVCRNGVELAIKLRYMPLVGAFFFCSSA